MHPALHLRFEEQENILHALLCGLCLLRLCSELLHRLCLEELSVVCYLTCFVLCSADVCIHLFVHDLNVAEIFCALVLQLHVQGLHRAEQVLHGVGDA